MLYMIPMDEEFRTQILNSQSVHPVAWVTLVGSRTGAAIRMQFGRTSPEVNYSPTIKQAIVAMRDPEHQLMHFVKSEDGAVVIWLEDITPVAIPTNEPPVRKQ